MAERKTCLLVCEEAGKDRRLRFEKRLLAREGFDVKVVGLDSNTDEYASLGSSEYDLLIVNGDGMEASAVRDVFESCRGGVKIFLNSSTFDDPLNDVSGAVRSSIQVLETPLAYPDGTPHLFLEAVRRAG